MDAWTSGLEILHLEHRYIPRKFECHQLPGRQLMLFREDIHTDQRLALLLHLGELPLQTEREVLQPIGQVKMLFAYTLNRPIVAGAIPIVIFAERK